MTKKLTRSRRKELRSRGHLELVSRPVSSTRAAERQAEEEAASARVQEARAEVAARPARASRRGDAVEADDPAPVKKTTAPRDLTVILLVVGLTAIAGVIFWLSQRPPASKDPGTEPATATSTARTPIIVNAPPPPRPAATLPPPVAAPVPVPPAATPPVAATPPPVTTVAPAAVPPPAAAPKPKDAPAAPAEPAKRKPSPAPAPAKPAPAADPYG